eukprot:CAMPEP_0113869512 /NCGR_PEP_ID=MMETSP0780_2-20120614/1575_1 /TAXON_ID=652834 /ORGANISM="Palpitomonas bilix" /LENGTH=117 /DNA_ID=CAMNT_0000854693 /DNA_START=741 /DNA_END=1095 /DNA_ORIENTATION=- /assembly_acc=CAM_ASM_000599
MSGLIKSVKKERMQYETLSSFIRAECRRTASPDTLRFSRTDEWTTPKPLPLSPNARRKKGTESSHSMSGTTREYLTSIGGSVMSQSTIPDDAAFNIKKGGAVSEMKEKKEKKEKTMR